ncbi:sigma-70 family RNA polymerase sigma factor [Evansella sp. AB-P1]|uniref:sigma-70 family RNA polymerase sigma factor n=1 Tax=Evansella sp. AB-P1 TaxID=3037653 RepID=UPI0024204C77|nr:sigma-70 family RNA polymerase sigma factor [Evansella sp. AB-P1]MDG5788224.1 sigma-70 family RNA polymerase sigma factor [Evansella sp. AB-P1]
MERKRKEKIEEIYRTYAKSLYLYLFRLSGSQTVAEDLVQDTFVKATISLSFYQDEEVKSWLFKVARHAYLDEWRKQKRWNWVPFKELIHRNNQMLGPYEEPEEYLLSKESEANVNTIYKHMPESYRAILYLREEEGLSYEELATALDRNENQIKVTLHRARQRFKELVRTRYNKGRE